MHSSVFLSIGFPFDIDRGLRLVGAKHHLHNPYHEPRIWLEQPQWWEHSTDRELQYNDDYIGTLLNSRRRIFGIPTSTELVMDNNYTLQFELLPRRVARAEETLRKINELYQHFCLE